MKSFVHYFCILLFSTVTNPIMGQPAPDPTLPWWKKNNLRVIQTNLPAYEAATLNPDSLVADLKKFAANTLIINAGGIMAFYPSVLKSHYINPYLKPDMLKLVVEKCHEYHIKVIMRFDFSRLDKTIYDVHPEWVYVDKNGDHMINTDKYVTCINAPYVQEEAFKIISEVIDLYPIDGIFLNMPGYQTNNAYEGKYHGIDQNEYDKKRFETWSGGLTLPLVEDRNDSIYLKYVLFRKYTTDAWQAKLAQVVKSKNPNIAICTYATEQVDIIRHESQTNSLPYFPYNASDNVNSMMTSYPDHIVSNASIQQISFQSRYNAIEPEEISIRLWENISNGSGLDLSLMGDLRDYEDERNYPVIEKIYNHHKRFEKYYGRYKSLAKIVVVAPGWWPSGVTMQEFRGIQLALKEAHLPFDIIEDSQIGTRLETLRKYRLIILPDIYTLNAGSIAALETLSAAGLAVLATNNSLKDRPDMLQEWFGVKPVNAIPDCSGQYISVPDHTVFTSLVGQSMIFLKFNSIEYDMSGCDQKFLPLLSKGRPGPPEMIGGHMPTGYYSIGIKDQSKSKNAILPLNLGKLYYLHGYEEHKNILLDLIHYLVPSERDILSTTAHPRVEVILKDYDFNDRNTYGKPFASRGMILHLINLTGFSGNTYFKASPQSNIDFNVSTFYKPSRVWNLETNKNIPFLYDGGRVKFTVGQLEDHAAICIDR